MKFFTKEVKIALTAIVAAALLFFIINFFKGINLFSPTNHYVVRFDNVAGLTVSAPVYANGYPVGTVRSISYDYASRDRVMVDSSSTTRCASPPEPARNWLRRCWEA